MEGEDSHMPCLSAICELGKQTNEQLFSMQQCPFEKLIVPQLVKKLQTFYGNRRFITPFKSARHLSLPRARALF